MTIQLHQELPTKHKEREQLREKGQFWTPSWVAEAMVAYVAENTELVFDPATGKGAFLKALINLNNSKNILFYGIDIDHEVLQDEIYDNTSCLVELRDFMKNPPQRKFKAIVANPPYIRHHRIDEETKRYLKRLCVEITNSTIDGRAGYHIYFLLQALRLLAEKGRLAFIMPADTCEGTFSKKLWNWITKNYCLECVVTFDENATPFPSVDTNAVIFFIKNDTPKKEIFWVKSNQAYSDDLKNFMLTGFDKTDFETLLITRRTLKEALSTGLSRPEQSLKGFKYHLSDFATVMRGIATGANDFFFLTKEQAEELHIPQEFLKLAIGRTKDICGDIVAMADIRKLYERKRPTLLLSIDQPEARLPKQVVDYLQKGVKANLHNRPLIKQRNPWFRMEKRKIPELLFAYLGRRNARFIKNEAKVLPLTGFLCVYPIYTDEPFVNSLWKVLNHPDTIKNLRLVGKSYGSGAIKVEPRNLDKLPIPEHLVEQYNIKRKYKSSCGQLNLFHESKEKYTT